MLKNIRLIDFKSFVDARVELSPLTFLVGANASGKSNFFDALRFLEGLNFDLSLAEVLNGEESTDYDAWPGIRGRAAETTGWGSPRSRSRAPGKCYWRGFLTLSHSRLHTA